MLTGSPSVVPGMSGYTKVEWITPPIRDCLDPRVRARLPALVFIATSVLFVCAGCSRQPSISAQYRQRLNRAWAYFLYAEADAQLDRLQRLPRPVRFTEQRATNWVITGLKEPALKVTKETEGLGGAIGFRSGIGFSGNWGRVLEENPGAKVADSLIRVFRDTPAQWNQRERLWNLGPDYAADYNWARYQDRFKFPLAFYQDPFSHTVE